MRRIFKICLPLIFVVFLSINIMANSIDSIDVKVNITKDGTAHILQEWKVNNTDGTEYYIPIQNLNHMELENFRVGSQDETNYGWMESIPWDVNRGFEDKRYKYGINYTNDGIELCWGKTQMGDYNYFVSFDYLNAVQAFDDADGFLIRFVNDNMNPAPKSVSVTITADGVNLDKNNSKIWSFGNRGSIAFEDGKVIATDDRFDGDSSMTIMMRFNKGILNPTYKGEGTFDDLEERAMDGSSFEGEKKSGGILNAISRMGPVFFMMIFYVFGLFIRKLKIYNKVKNLREVDFKNPPYYRDELLDNFIPAIYFMAYQKDAPKNIQENTFSAYFLKWIKDGALGVDEYSKLKGDDMQNLIIYKDPKIRSEVELKLWSVVVEAAGKNKILEPDELETYFKKHYQKYNKLFQDLYNEGRDYLVDKKMLTLDSGMQFTESGIRECQNAYAMRRFFKDFTLINEREVKEVQLWDYYLIIATIYGMGEEVSKAFEKLVPEYVYAQETTANGIYIHPYDMYYMSRRMGRYANAGYGSGASSAARSGFGGGASFGGGGGFSGGGSGGGSR